jgi:hypothetical protein
MTKRMEMRSGDVLHSEALDAIDVALDVLHVPEQPSSIRGQHDNQPSLSRLPLYADSTATMSLVASFASLMASDGERLLTSSRRLGPDHVELDEEHAIAHRSLAGVATAHTNF